MQNDMYLALLYHTWQFHHSKKSPCVTYLSLSSLILNPRQPLILYCLYCSFAFFKISHTGNHTVCSLSDWLLSCSNLKLSFLQICSWLCSSLLFIAESYSSIWIYHSLLIHSPAKRHVGCFQVLAIMKKAALNIHMRVDRRIWVWILTVLFQIYYIIIAIVLNRKAINYKSKVLLKHVLTSEAYFSQ